MEHFADFCFAYPILFVLISLLVTQNIYLFGHDVLKARGKKVFIVYIIANNYPSPPCN
jgi:hypothetical protein